MKNPFSSTNFPGIRPGQPSANRWPALVFGLFLGLVSLSPATPSSQGHPWSFTSTTQPVRVLPHEVSIVEWIFTNNGSTPLKVERFDQSCDCLLGVIEDAPVPPGATGKVRARFTPGAYRGVVAKSLRVRFAGHPDPVELTVAASIPSTVEVSRRELTWSADAPTATQTIDLTSGTGVPFAITGWSGVPDGQFRISTRAVKPGQHHQLEITPEVAVRPGPHTLIVTTDSPDPRDKSFALFLHAGNPATAATHP